MIAIAERTLIRRINRKLAHENKRLHKSRSIGQVHNLGDYHVVDTWHNALIDSHVDLVKLARELQVLATNEEFQR